MRRAERPPRHERLADRQHARHGVDLRGLERLVETHLREDGGEPPGEHCLAAARRADHQNVMPPSGGDLERALRVRLPDRKSTRLNSSHTVISYAVFCLKKKKKKMKKIISE